MRIVFLDFDNVLNDDDTEDWIKPGPGLFVEGHTGLDREKVERLNRLAAPDVRFVFSTSWRKWYTDEQLLKVLQDRGFKGQIHEESPRTPLRFSYTSREHQIQEWLDDARYDNDLPTSFVVLDDLTTKYVDLNRHVQTYGDEGALTEAKADQALGILNVPCLAADYGLEDEPGAE